jgi:fumarate reductase flavoprotein subunit
MSFKENMMEQLTRRGFLRGALLAGASVGGAGMLVACSPNSDESSSQGSGVSSTASSQNTNANRDIGSSSFELTADSISADSTEEVDVVVVGSGLGGFAAALTVAEEKPGANVVLLEKNGALGGSTNFAECPVGTRPFVYGESEARAAAADQLEYTHGVCDPMLIYSMCRDMEENTGWLFDKHGVEWYKDGQAPAFYEGGNGTSAIKTLSAQAEQVEGLQILTDTTATQLLLDGEYAVTGLRAKASNGGYVDYHARAVVLATGGMSTNLTLLAEYSSQDVDKTIGWGQGQDGDGQLMVEQTAHGRANHLSLMSLFNNVKGFAYDSALGVCVSMQPTNFWVNQNGLRFMDENISNTAVSGKVVEEQGSVWSILDADAIDKYAAGACTRHYSGFADKLAGNPVDGLPDEIAESLTSNGAECFKADNIQDLAKAIGVDAGNLQTEVDAYSTGIDERWGKEAELIWPLKTAPFYAFRLCSGTLCTCGGIRINTTAQVVDARGKVIDGLYAAGVCTSGWDGEVYRDGTGQPNALYCGRTAAKHIAANLL